MCFVKCTRDVSVPEACVDKSCNVTVIMHALILSSLKC